MRNARTVSEMNQNSIFDLIDLSINQFSKFFIETKRIYKNKKFSFVIIAIYINQNNKKFVFIALNNERFFQLIHANLIIRF